MPKSKKPVAPEVSPEIIGLSHILWPIFNFDYENDELKKLCKELEDFVNKADLKKSQDVDEILNQIMGINFYCISWLLAAYPESPRACLGQSKISCKIYREVAVFLLPPERLPWIEENLKKTVETCDYFLTSSDQPTALLVMQYLFQNFMQVKQYFPAEEMTGAALELLDVGKYDKNDAFLEFKNFFLEKKVAALRGSYQDLLSNKAQLGEEALDNRRKITLLKLKSAQHSFREFTEQYPAKAKEAEPTLVKADETAAGPSTKAPAILPEEPANPPISLEKNTPAVALGAELVISAQPDRPVVARVSKNKSGKLSSSPSVTPAIQHDEEKAPFPSPDAGSEKENAPSVEMPTASSSAEPSQHTSLKSSKNKKKSKKSLPISHENEPVRDENEPENLDPKLQLESDPKPDPQLEPELEYPPTTLAAKKQNKSGTSSFAPENFAPVAKDAPSSSASIAPVTRSTNPPQQRPPTISSLSAKQQPQPRETDSYPAEELSTMVYKNGISPQQLQKLLKNNKDHFGKVKGSFLKWLSHSGPEGFTPLCSLVYWRNLPALEILLSSLAEATGDTKREEFRSCLIKRNHAGLTPLSVACQRGYFDITNKLLLTGAEAFAGKFLEFITPANEDFSPLHQAVHKNHQEIVKLLLEFAAKKMSPSDFEIFIHCEDKNCRTPLHAACLPAPGYPRRQEIIDLLMNHHANPKRKNKHGRTMRDDSHLDKNLFNAVTSHSKKQPEQSPTVTSPKIVGQSTHTFIPDAMTFPAISSKPQQTKKLLYPTAAFPQLVIQSKSTQTTIPNEKTKNDDVKKTYSSIVITGESSTTAGSAPNPTAAPSQLVIQSSSTQTSISTEETENDGVKTSSSVVAITGESSTTTSNVPITSTISAPGAAGEISPPRAEIPATPPEETIYPLPEIHQPKEAAGEKTSLSLSDYFREQLSKIADEKTSLPYSDYLHPILNQASCFAESARHDYTNGNREQAISDFFNSAHQYEKVGHVTSAKKIYEEILALPNNSSRENLESAIACCTTVEYWYGIIAICKAFLNSELRDDEGSLKAVRCLAVFNTPIDTSSLGGPSQNSSSFHPEEKTQENPVSNENESLQRESVTPVMQNDAEKPPLLLSGADNEFVVIANAPNLTVPPPQPVIQSSSTQTSISTEETEDDGVKTSSSVVVITGESSTTAGNVPITSTISAPGTAEEISPPRAENPATPPEEIIHHLPETQHTETASKKYFNKMMCLANQYRASARTEPEQDKQIEAFFKSAECFKKVNHFTQAKQVYQEILSLFFDPSDAPEYKKAKFNETYCHSKKYQKKFREKTELYTDFFQIYPNLFDVNPAIAIDSCMEKGDLEEAIAVCEVFLSLNPNDDQRNLEAQRYLGFFYKQRYYDPRSSILSAQTREKIRLEYRDHPLEEKKAAEYERQIREEQEARAQYEKDSERKAQNAHVKHKNTRPRQESGPSQNPTSFFPSRSAQGNSVPSASSSRWPSAFSKQRR